MGTLSVFVAILSSARRTGVSVRHILLLTYHVHSGNVVHWRQVLRRACELVCVCVVVSPEISLPNRGIAQSRGRETILECIITAQPHAVNYWYKDGRRIVSSARQTTIIIIIRPTDSRNCRTHRVSDRLQFYVIQRLQ